MASMPFFRMGPPPRSFAADAHYCIMVRVSGPPNTRTRHEHFVRDTRAPLLSSSRHGQVCRRARRVGRDEETAARFGAVQGQAFGGRQDAASLDRSSARRPVDVWVGTKKRLPGRTKKLSDEKVDRTLVMPP